MKYIILIMTAVVVLFADVEFRVEFDNVPDPVEIVFVMDSSGSMGSVVDGMRDDLYAFLDTLYARDFSFRLGNVTYGDGTSFWDFDVSSPEPNMTSSRVHFRAMLDGMGVSSGGDWNETSIDAIYDGAEYYDWSPDTVRLMMMFTDAPFHFPGDGTSYSDVTPETTLDKLLEKEICLYIAATTSSDYANSWFDSLCRTTGGAIFPLPTFRDPLIPGWPDVFGAMFDSVRTRNERNDIHGLPTTVTGITDMELQAIEIYNLRSGLLRGPDYIDLTGTEFDDLDSLRVIWEINDPLPLHIDSTAYTVTLHTTSGDFWESGVIWFVSDVEERRDLPDNLSISAYPNPFNSSVTISVEQTFLSVQNDPSQTGMSGLPIQIEIYDVNGRKIADCENIRSLSGAETTFPRNSLRLTSAQLSNHRSGSEFVWQPDEALGSGVYLVRAKCLGNKGGQPLVLSKRLVYLK